MPKRSRPTPTSRVVRVNISMYPEELEALRAASLKRRMPISRIIGELVRMDVQWRGWKQTEIKGEES